MKIFPAQKDFESRNEDMKHKNLSRRGFMATTKLASNDILIICRLSLRPAVTHA